MSKKTRLQARVKRIDDRFIKRGGQTDMDITEHERRINKLAKKGGFSSPFMAKSPLNNGDKKYKKGDLLSETDWETNKYKSTSEGKKYVRHNIQDVSEVQEDDKGQFVTTLGDDEITPSLQIGKNPKFSSDSTIMENALRPKVRIARDTIRPRNSKNFKGY